MKTLIIGPGDTRGGALRKLASMLPEDDGVRLFMEWLTDNTPGLKRAVADLGIEVAEGPGFFQRLRVAVTPILVERARQRQADARGQPGPE